MSSLSKYTGVIGHDIRKTANPMQPCLLTHCCSQAAMQTLLPELVHMQSSHTGQSIACRILALNDLQNHLRLFQ